PAPPAAPPRLPEIAAATRNLRGSLQGPWIPSRSIAATRQMKFPSPRSPNVAVVLVREDVDHVVDEKVIAPDLEGVARGARNRLPTERELVRGAPIERGIEIDLRLIRRLAQARRAGQALGRGELPAGLHHLLQLADAALQSGGGGEIEPAAHRAETPLARRPIVGDERFGALAHVGLGARC